ncbi:MAG: hypothetical protein D6773_14910 [Alphaproteobacteria bacterium]|nr:MAG: hypothetical protein D6773_14910 [Alphaproteobacteria bacterium]
MSISALDRIKKIFGNAELPDEEREELTREALLMTLARGAIADTNVGQREVAVAQEVYKKITGQDLEASHFHYVAGSEMFERGTTHGYLSKVQAFLHPDDKLKIINGLADLLRADRRVTSQEVAFFNDTVRALDLSAADVAGLRE